MGRPRPPPRAAPPAPASAGAHTHLQHELTLVSPHEDELSREPVAGAAAAHQEPRGDAHLGAHEARLALGVGGVIREGAPPPPRPRPLGTLKARSEPALLGLKHLHGATTAAAFRKAGLQASPSRTMPVLHRPPPRLRSPLMLWAHVYPLLCLGARAQEGGGAVVPEVLGADVVGGLGGGPLPAAQRRVTTSTSSQTHSYHTRMHTASKHTRSTAHKLPSHDPGAGVRTRRHHPGLWGPHTVPALWGFLPAGRQAPRRGAACAKVPATQRNKGTGSAGGGGPSKAGGGEVGTRAPGAALQAEGRAKAQMLGHACLGVQWLAQEWSRRPGGPRACCHPGC